MEYKQNKDDQQQSHYSIVQSNFWKVLFGHRMDYHSSIIRKRSEKSAIGAPSYCIDTVFVMIKCSNQMILPIFTIEEEDQTSTQDLFFTCTILVCIPIHAFGIRTQRRNVPQVYQTIGTGTQYEMIVFRIIFHIPYPMLMLSRKSL